MKRFVNILLIIITISMLACSIAVSGAYFYASQYSENSIDDNLLVLKNGSDSQIYWYVDGKEEKMDGGILSGGIKYKYTQYKDIPKTLTESFIAIEDKNFYKHNGVDFPRTAKAGLNYILRFTSNFGASTITQQLVKNITGNDEISIDRKLSEIFSALDLERRYDKSEILEAYLNVINLSDGCRGVAAAAEYYFSKDLHELSLSECASIAAITNNPSRYNPISHPENNKKRRELILLCMQEQGYITEEEYSDAIEKGITLNPKNKRQEQINSWYADMVTEDVIQALCEKYSINRNSASLMLYTGGLKIYTPADKDIQSLVEKHYSDESNFAGDPKDGIQPQSAMIIIEAKTGNILGVAGAIGKKSGNRVQNYATDTLRPPGSAIKPLSVFAPAIEKGLIKWSSIIEDSPTKVLKNGSGWPANANGIYLGNIDIQTAVEQSTNTVAVKLLSRLGEETSFKFLKEKLGIKSLIESSDKNVGDVGAASLALGQPSRGITLRELVGGYTVFNNGVYSKPRSFLKVTDQEGNIILENSIEQNIVLKRETAAIMTKLLEGVVDSGTARKMIGLDERISVAGKTGTTSDNCDKLFVGYTPELVGGVWFGYDYPKPLNKFGRNPSAEIWDNVMNKIYSSDITKFNKSSFTVPDKVYKLTYNKKTGEPPTEGEERIHFSCGYFSE